MANDTSRGGPPGKTQARPAPAAHVAASVARSRAGALQAKAAPAKAAPASHVARAIQAKPAPSRPVVAAHLTRALQAKPAPPAAPRPAPAGRPSVAPARRPAAHPLQLKPRPAAAPLPAGRRVVQRMEMGYSGSNGSNDDDRGNERRRSQDRDPMFKFGDMPFFGLKGEAITIVDQGGRFSARVGEREVGYVTYEIERRNPQLGIAQDRLRFGYINVTSKAFRSTKLSSLLLFFLANKAATLGLMVIAVGHPDPGLEGYWSAMGFDLAAARRRQLNYYATQLGETGERLYSDEQLPALEDVTVTEAEIPTHTLLHWAQSSYRKYWGGPPSKKDHNCVVQ